MSSQNSPSRPARDEALVSVVAPVYNEAVALPQLVESVAAALDAAAVRYEIVLVNDGSTDGSGAILDGLAQRHPFVRAVHLSRNFGHQAAVQAGITVARGDAVILMDSDLQDAPAALPQFIDLWLEGNDVVYAIRTERKEGPLKRWAYSTFYRLLAAISSTRIPLDAGIFGLMDRRVVNEVAALEERDRFLPGLRSWVGFRQTGVVVERLARYDDHPRISFFGLCRLAKTAVFSFSSFPLKLFYLIGFSALGVFAALGAYSIFCKLFTDLAVPGWTSHVLSASFFGALNALGISILGEYVTRIYDQVRRRPVFLIDRIAGGPMRQATAEDAQLLELLNQVRTAVDKAARVSMAEAPHVESIG